MANTAKCERCGGLYEAGSEEQACGPNPLCRQCVKVIRWLDTLNYSRGECEKWAAMTSGGHRSRWQRMAEEYAEIISFITVRANAPVSPVWTCGCGHVNGANLPTCAACGRRPLEV